MNIAWSHDVDEVFGPHRLAGASTVQPWSSRRVMTPAQPEASAKAPWTRTMVGLGPLSWRAVTAAAADVAGLAEAQIPARRSTPMMADSAASRVLVSLRR